MNLKTEQSKYRIRLDESFDAELFGNYDAESIAEVRSHKEHFYEIPAKNGFIYFFSPVQLAATFVSSEKIARSHPVFKFIKKNGYERIQTGDWEITFKFPNAELNKVADFMGAYKKRHISEEQKQKLVHNLNSNRTDAQ